ncbi:hypothetical protein AAF712_008932 [Marasmius tenuissimus]|uniref:EF-hand domain-containing protein n=1 Tax=Marasmius tenuissimus TaxID=585030 RepID=A0ABR2ZRP2_9AGAR
MAQYGGGYGGGPQGGYGGSQGGYGGGPGYAQGPPPGHDPQLWQWFSAVDTDRSGHITADELQRALVNGDWSAFDIDTVKLLMTMFDTDRSGTIGFNEVCSSFLPSTFPSRIDQLVQFSGVWKYVKDWQNVFRHFDKDQSGSIDGSELSSALQQFGYNLSPELLNLVQRKYDPKGSGGSTRAVINAPPAGISFDRFVRACVVIKQLHDMFGRLDTDKDGWVQVNYEQFMHTVLTLP